jgi:GcrA cell cycle regulator
MTSAERCVAIVEIYPSTKGTGRTIAEALTARFKVQITRSSVISMYARHADKLKTVPLTGPSKATAGGVTGKAKPAEKKIRRPSALMVASGMQFITPKPKPAPKPKPVEHAVPVRRAVQPEAHAVASLPVPVPKNLELYQLERCDCRWPVSGNREKTLFCARATRLETPYCDFHAALSVGTGSRAERSAVPARLMR